MNVDERRAWPRDACSNSSTSYVARVRSGHEVLVIDVSFGGVLIDAPIRLAPESTIDLRLTASHGVISVRGRVVRCYVSSLHPEAVRYRAALAFDRPIDLPAPAAAG